MAILNRYDTPARLRDVPDDSTFYADWSNFVSDQIRALTPGDSAGAFYLILPSLTWSWPGRNF